MVKAKSGIPALVRITATTDEGCGVVENTGTSRGSDSGGTGLPSARAAMATGRAAPDGGNVGASAAGMVAPGIPGGTVAVPPAATVPPASDAGAPSPPCTSMRCTARSVRRASASTTLESGVEGVVPVCWTMGRIPSQRS